MHIYFLKKQITICYFLKKMFLFKWKISRSWERSIINIRVFHCLQSTYFCFIPISFIHFPRGILFILNNMNIFLWLNVAKNYMTVCTTPYFAIRKRQYLVCFFSGIFWNTANNYNGEKNTFICNLEWLHYSHNSNLIMETIHSSFIHVISLMLLASREYLECL
jgi:hypothetical protein